VKADIHEVTLENLGSGVALELFANEFAKILDNIDDPNTEPTMVRRLTIKISVKPSRDRSTAAFSIQAESKIASGEAHLGFIHLSKTGARLHAYTADQAPKLNGFETPTNVVPIEGGNHGQ
jgi:hypothetical protein